MTGNTMESNTPEVQVGRNEPCPCGSGKKFKRCHGVDAAPKLSTPTTALAAPDGAAGAPGAANGLPFDPSQLDPAMMMQVSQALQRLPRGQMQRLQAIMQKAMSGKDVTREAAEFEKTLPPAFKSLMTSFQQQAAPLMAQQSAANAPAATATGTGSTSSSMTADEARKIVEQAAAEGKISADQAQELLAAQAEPSTPAGGSKFGRLWKKLGG